MLRSGWHLPGNNDDGDIILFTPEVKVLEPGVKADVCLSAVCYGKRWKAYCLGVARHI